MLVVYATSSSTEITWEAHDDSDDRRKYELICGDTIHANAKTHGRGMHIMPKMMSDRFNCRHIGFQEREKSDRNLSRQPLARTDSSGSDISLKGERKVDGRISLRLRNLKPSIPCIGNLVTSLKFKIGRI
jgi:hypothetical protein